VKRGLVKRDTLRAGSIALIGAASMLLAAPAELLHAQDSSQDRQTRRISVTWTETPIAEVLQAFAYVSGASIVAGAGVDGLVTADINDQPWDVALGAILSTRGLVATEDEHGIIRVESMAELDARETVEPLLSRSYRISFSDASEIQAAVAPLLSSRGSVSVVPSTNTLVVSDVARVQRAIASLLR
jgi:type II secretory pathway component HofQ